MNVYILFSVDTGVSFTIMTQRDEGGKNFRPVNFLS